MITAMTSCGEIKVDFVINRDDKAFTKRCYLVQCSIGYVAANCLIFADCAQDAIDTLADSKRSYLIDTDVLCDVCEKNDSLPENERDYNECYCNHAGNDSHKVDLDNVSLLDVTKVNWFAKDV